MASKLTAYAFSFAAGAYLYSFCKDYKIEQNMFRMIAVEMINRKVLRFFPRFFGQVGFMASKLTPYAFSFAAGAYLYSFYKDYKIEQDMNRMIAVEMINRKKKEMRSDSDEFEALKQDIKAIKQHLDMENGKKDRPTETGESD